MRATAIILSTIFCFQCVRKLSVQKFATNTKSGYVMLLILISNPLNGRTLANICICVYTHTHAQTHTYIHTLAMNL